MPLRRLIESNATSGKAVSYSRHSSSSHVSEIELRERRFLLVLVVVRRPRGAVLSGTSRTTMDENGCAHFVKMEGRTRLLPLAADDQRLTALVYTRNRTSVAPYCFWRTMVKRPVSGHSGFCGALSRMNNPVGSRALRRSVDSTKRRAKSRSPGFLA